jgi:hypothetical protein
MVRIVKRPICRYAIDVNHHRPGQRPQQAGVLAKPHKALSVPTPRKVVQPKPSISDLLKQAGITNESNT